MGYTREITGGTRAINRVETFVDALAGRSILSLPDFDAFMLDAELLVRGEYPAVSQGALNNSRGDWYESLIVLGASQYVLEYAADFVLVRLPNVNSFACENLYEDDISELVGDLRKVLDEEADVSLISSNPDFVVISRKLIELDDTSDGSAENLVYLDNLYSAVSGKCGFSDIVAYCSVKSGLRPDRRLQIAHEGSLMKALYRHVQTRLWEINAPGLKYFGIAGACSDADRRALKTVATHSIVDVSSKPESAVDELYKVSSGTELSSALAEILNI